MKKLKEIVSDIFIPKIKIDQDKREVSWIKASLFGNRILESYYILKGYNIKGNY
jgi:hypothetical protein